MATLRNVPPMASVVSVGANSALVSFAFFGMSLPAPACSELSPLTCSRSVSGIRELAIQPTFRDLGIGTGSNLRPHTEGLGSTALAGGLTGAAFMGKMRMFLLLLPQSQANHSPHAEGPRRALSGGVTASLLCSAIHLALNEVSLLRIFVLARRDFGVRWTDMVPTINMDAGGWSPVRRIPDDEYRSKLQNKIRRLDQHISQLDKDIAALQLEQTQKDRVV